MHRRILPRAIAALSLIIAISFGCTKLDTTKLGTDLITVDNVNTFDTTLSVITSQGIFDDTTTLVLKNENHVIGNISDDPIFGKTQSEIYLQLKPPTFPFYFANAGDTTRNSVDSRVKMDSAVLCLSYKGAYGDTSDLAPTQHFEVLAISDANFRDSNYLVRNLKYKPNYSGTVIGSADISPKIAAKKVRYKWIKDSVDHQIRIPLDYNFANAIYNFDTTSTAPNNGFRNDSIFKNRVNGFAIRVNGPGSNLFYVNLAEAKTQLQFFFRRLRNNVVDTVYQSFPMYARATVVAQPSSTGNFVKRDYSGKPVQTGDLNHIYIQNAPGTFAMINIPGLQNLQNRIIHRAYLIAEQVPDLTTTYDKFYRAPPYMYMDLRDSTVAEKYKPIYYDLNPSSAYLPDGPNYYFPFGNVDPTYFGGVSLTRYENGNEFSRYELNITRYIQKLVTSHGYNYSFRLYAPYTIRYPQYGPTPLSDFGPTYNIPFYNQLAGGRVRLGSGSNPNHTMKLVIIYSKI